MAYVITGRKDTGEVASRREIRDISTDPALAKQWSLFVLGLHAVQYPDVPVQGVKTSFKASDLLPPGGDYFSIGAVHGLPYERWAGDPYSDTINPQPPLPLGPGPVKPSDAAAEKKTAHTHTAGEEPPVTPGDASRRYGGYCNHASILFPPWHRPYLMALEQSIGIMATAAAKDFASTHPDEAAEWEAAAKALRLPFWDWTLPPKAGEKAAVPDIVLQDTVEILVPGKEKIKVPNPVFAFHLEKYLHTDRTYQFADVEVQIPWSSPPGDPPKTMMAYYASWPRTVRWPEPSPTPVDQPLKIQEYMADRYAANREKVGNLFLFQSPAVVDKREWPTNWDKFSNTRQQSDPPAPDAPSSSLEAPHNTIHVVMGGVGHMGQNEYAGFDPIFFLHHCNVDRIYALWEWCYPEYKPGYGYYPKNEPNAELQHFGQEGGTYIQLPNSRLDQWTEMWPWRNDLDTYWTTDLVSWENRKNVPTYYTYPPCAGVDVTNPSTGEAERAKARRALQEHFGVRVSDALNVIQKKTSPLFNLESGTFTYIPHTRSEVPTYRHFIVRSELVENLYNDSYFLEILYNDGDQVHYAHSTVLTRPDNTYCAACQDRRAAGVKVKDAIPINTEHVHKIISKFPEDRPRKSEQDDIYALKGFFSGRLIHRNGQILAYTVPKDANTPEKEILPDRLAPKLELYTAYAAKSNEDDYGADEAPYELFGYQNHKALFENSVWKIGAPDEAPKY